MKKRRLAAVAAGALFTVLATSAPTAVAVDGPASGQTIFAVANGARELKPDLTRHGGDPDGRGSFSATVTGNQFCYGLTVSGIDTPTAAHIHKAPKTANGPVVIPLTPPSSGNPGSSSGCVTADPALLADILARAPQYYVNVHNPAYPAGAIRGQLFVR